MSLPLVPALHLDDEHSSVHAVARATVDSAVRQAVHDVVQVVQDATQWLSQAVGHELLSQAVAAASDGTTRVETYCESCSGAHGLPLPSIEPPNARIHAVAEATVDAVVHEALHDVTQAVESATEWLTQAVRGELVSHAVAEASTAVAPTAEPSTVGLEADETSSTPHEAAKALLSLNVHAVAEATADAVVLEAVQSVTQAVEDATDWLTLAIGDELVSRAVADAASIADVDPTTDSNASSKAEREPSPSAGAAPIQVPILRLPRSAHGREEASTAPLESSHHCLQLAQPFVAQAISSALQQALAFQKPPESEHTPTVASPPESTPTTIPASAPVEESVPQPTASLIEAAPPDTPPTSRRKSPNTRKRTLEVPKQSAPVHPAAPSAAVETPAAAPTHSVLPPLILPGSQGTPRHGKVLHHPHKAPHQSPPQSSKTVGSPRGASTSPTKPKAGLSLAGELELTPLSSARAASRIYAQQQPSSRSSRQQHKSKLRDSACQTSPPSSPPPSPPRRRRSHDPNDDGATNASRTKYHSHSKHSSSRHTPDNSTEQKATGKKSTLLLPLANIQAAHPTAEATKAPSPSRVIKSRARARKEGGAVVSPSKTRSGFCQRCVFEGRSCKVNDCLKHQLLK